MSNVEAAGEVFKLYCEYYNRTDRMYFNPHLSLWEDGSGEVSCTINSPDTRRSEKVIIARWDDLNHGQRVLRRLLDG